ncbi:MAG TPA: Ig-like domain-containing protein, partial [Dehalococcoidia bacterium]|nr:Ig-like domain-containing protein [Dehalococcoidia bacterium]
HPDLDSKLVAGANFVTVPVATSSNASGKVRVTTNTAHSYLNGDQVTSAGHSVAGVNGTWTISMPAALNIASSTLSGGTITVTTSGAHGLSTGNFVMVRDHSIGEANGEWVVTAVPNATQFQYSCAPDCTTGSGTGGVVKEASWFDLAGSTYASAGTAGSATNVSPRDDEGHGTFVSGIVGAESNNGAGAAGVCWGCKIMPVKVLGSTGTGSTAAVAAGIDWAVDHGADVINLSLSSSSSTQTMLDAVNYAWNNGVIVVAASGNADSSVAYPAKYANVIAVGATDSDGARASFSNYGPELDVVAPGDTVLSTTGTGFGDSGGWYGFGSGTSFSSPHVAGVVGLLISHGITDKNAIVDALTSTATDAGTPGFDNQYGWGIVDAASALTGGADTTPPVVAITSPEDGAVVSGVVTIAATASDVSGVQKVRFWVDNSYLSFDLTAPYSKNWDTTGWANGSHVIKAQAVDDAGNESAIVTITVTIESGDSTPPSVNITSPTNGATVSGAVAIAASATDASGVQKVRFWVDNSYLSFDLTAPYSKSWDTAGWPNGPHVVKVQAVDEVGNESPVLTITVNIDSGDSTPPAVNITSPGDGATVSGTVSIAASANDASGVQKVRFWVDNSYLSFDLTAPYSKNWNTIGWADGAHVIKVQAVDTVGNESAIVTVTVTIDSGDSTPPTVSITSPADGATVSGTAAISVSASDASGIQKVRFWVDNGYLSFDLTAPYTKSWDTTGWGNGLHVIKVQAVDHAGNESSIVTITVNVSN